MARKKSDQIAKDNASQIQARFRKAGPMKHRNDRRRSQKEKRFDEKSES